MKLGKFFGIRGWLCILWKSERNRDKTWILAPLYFIICSLCSDPRIKYISCLAGLSTVCWVSQLSMEPRFQFGKKAHWPSVHISF